MAILAQRVYNLEVNGEHVYYVGQVTNLLVHNSYPHEIMAGSPLRLFQSIDKMDMEKVDRYTELMKSPDWKWEQMKDKIIIDPNGQIMSGHHRVMAARKAGVEIPESAIFRYPSVSVRPTYDWQGNLVD